jgi:hypothetical protein
VSGVTTTSQRWAALASVLVGLIGLQWWLTPETYPFGPDDEAGNLSFLTRLEAGSAAALAGILAVAGVVTARAVGRRRGRRLALVGVGLQVVVLGYVVPDITALMVVAYLLALVGPVVALGFVAYRSLRRWPGAATVVLAGSGAAATLTGIVTPSALGGLARGVAGGFENLGTRPLYILGALAAGALWATVLVDAARDGRARCGECGRTRWGSWTRPGRAASWGRKATWVAALGPVPYAVLRLTWLTPWPVGISPEELVDNPGLRLFGLMLGLVAFGGVALTLGLTYRWGEVFPRWVPWLRGRAVPVAAAVWPALVVAVTVTVGGHSIVQAAAADTEGWRAPVGLVLVFPFPVWGPVLAVAAYGYALRRRSDCAGCPPSAPPDVPSEAVAVGSDSAPRSRALRSAAF